MVSSCRSYYSYSDSDNAWEPVRDEVSKIIIQEGITSIPEEEFKYFSNLTEVEIESGLKNIGTEAFAVCELLRKITIPKSVVDIGTDILWSGYYWSFSTGNRAVFATIYCYSDSVAEQYAKDNGISYVLLDVFGTQDASDNQNNSSSFSIINNYQSETSTVAEKYTVGNQTYEVTSTDSSGNGTLKLINVNTKVKNVSIPSTLNLNGYTYKVTSIANNAFKGCTTLKTVTIGDNVTTIGNNAFYGCSKLKSVVIGKNVKKIGSKAFYGCKSLKKITIKSKKLKSIGSKAIFGINKNATIKVPKAKKKTYKKLFKAKTGFKKTMKLR